MYFIEIGLEFVKVFDGEISFGYLVLKGEKVWYFENISLIFSSYLERFLDLLKLYKGVECVFLRIGVDEVIRRYFVFFCLFGFVLLVVKNDILKVLLE